MQLTELADWVLCCSIINGTLGSTHTILSIGLFLLFVLLVFGVVGMHLFGKANKIANHQLSGCALRQPIQYLVTKATCQF